AAEVDAPARRAGLPRAGVAPPSAARGDLRRAGALLRRRPDPLLPDSSAGAPCAVLPPARGAPRVPLLLLPGRRVGGPDALSGPSRAHRGRGLGGGARRPRAARSRRRPSPRAGAPERPRPGPLRSLRDPVPRLPRGPLRGRGADALPLCVRARLQQSQGLALRDVLRAGGPRRGRGPADRPRPRRARRRAVPGPLAGGEAQRGLRPGHHRLLGSAGLVRADPPLVAGREVPPSRGLPRGALHRRPGVPDLLALALGRLPRRHVRSAGPLPELYVRVRGRPPAQWDLASAEVPAVHDPAGDPARVAGRAGRLVSEERPRRDAP